MRTTTEIDAHFDGYCMGLLRASEFLFEAGDDVLAVEMITLQLPDVSIPRLKKLARRENIRIKWADVEHEIAYRKSLRAAPSQEGGSDE